MVIWRYNPDGSLDTSFNKVGVVVHHNAARGGSNDEGNDIVVAADGKILVAGSSITSSDTSDMVIWRYNSDGALDTTFNQNGSTPGVVVRGKAENGIDVGNSLVLDADGKILVTGFSTNLSGTTDMAIWRYNSNGTPDVYFGLDGFLVQDGAAGGSSHDIGYSIALDAVGKILVTGFSVNASSRTDMVIWRYSASGSLDLTFHDGYGYVVHNNNVGGNNEDVGRSLTLDSNGRILVAGYSVNTFGNNDMALWRYHPDGSLDTSFSTDGMTVHDSAAGGNGVDQA